MNEIIAEKVKHILLNEMGIELGFHVANRLQNFDSLDLVELVLYVERDLKIVITDAEMYSIKCMDDLVNLIDSKLNTRYHGIIGK